MGKIIVCWAARTGAVLMILLDVPHYFFGLPPERVSGDSGVNGTIYMFWLLSVISMFLIGIMLLLVSNDLKNGKRSAWWAALFYGVGVGAFGAITIAKYGHDVPHIMIVYLIDGLIVLLPALVFSRSYFGKEASSS